MVCRQLASWTVDSCRFSPRRDLLNPAQFASALRDLREDLLCIARMRIRRIHTRLLGNGGGEWSGGLWHWVRLPALGRSCVVRLALYLGYWLGPLLDAVGWLVLRLRIRMGMRVWAMRLVAFSPSQAMVGARQKLATIRQADGLAPD